MIASNGEEIQKGIKSVLKELGEKVKDKAIDFAKDKGISIAANLVGKIPVIGDILKDWVLEYKQDPTNLLKDMVKLDPSEWDKFEAILKKYFDIHFSNHKVWLEARLNKQQSWHKKEYKNLETILLNIKERIEMNDKIAAKEAELKINEGIELVNAKFGRSIGLNREMDITFNDKRFLSIIESTGSIYSEKFGKIKNVDYYKTIGNFCFYYGDYEKAIKCYNIALNINPHFKEGFNNIGVVLLTLGKSQQAIDYFDKALKLDSKYAEAWNGKGVALDALKESKKSLKCFNKALNSNSNYAEAWNSKGVAHYNLGQIKKAIKCYDKALKININYAHAWNNMGGAYGKLHQDKKALECFNNAIKINSKYASAWNNKGKALNNLGEKQEAKVCFKMAKKYGFKT